MKKYNYAFGTVCILFFLSGNFLICTINGGEERDEGRRNVKDMGEKERKKERKRWGVYQREGNVVMLSLIKWVPHFSKYLQKYFWAMLF